MGIRPREAGFGSILIQPQPGGLQHAELRLPTIRGPVHARFECDGANFTLDVELPANMHARVILPAAPNSPPQVVENLGAGRHVLRRA